METRRSARVRARKRGHSPVDNAASPGKKAVKILPQSRATKSAQSPSRDDQVPPLESQSPTTGKKNDATGSKQCHESSAAPPSNTSPSSASGGEASPSNSSTLLPTSNSSSFAKTTVSAAKKAVVTWAQKALSPLSAKKNKSFASQNVASDSSDSSIFEDYDCAHVPHVLFKDKDASKPKNQHAKCSEGGPDVDITIADDSIEVSPRKGDSAESSEEDDDMDVVLLGVKNVDLKSVDVDGDDDDAKGEDVPIEKLRRFAIPVPAGKLGMTVGEDSKTGNIVIREIKSSCPVKEYFLAGDRLLRIDEWAVSKETTLNDVVYQLRKRRHSTRIITIGRKKALEPSKPTSSGKKLFHQN